MELDDNNFAQDSQSDSDDDFTQNSLSDWATRCTYLKIYSQIDESKFLTRERFANAIVNAFNEAEGKVYVEHWACCLESHKSGGEHFHFCVKLSEPRQWKPIREAVSNKHGVILNSSGKHNNYTAFKHVIKIDNEVLMSPRHRRNWLTENKKVCQGILWKIQKGKAENEFKLNDKNKKKDTTNVKSKIRRLFSLDVSEFLVKFNIKDTTELFALTQERKQVG